MTGVISDRSAPASMVTAPEAGGIEIWLVPSATDPAVDGVSNRTSRVDRDLGDTPTSTSSLLG